MLRGVGSTMGWEGQLNGLDSLAYYIYIYMWSWISGVALSGSVSDFQEIRFVG